MKRVVFIGSHLGYPMDRTPLGGGAMVGLQMVRAWARHGGFDLTVLGSGPESPGPGLLYERIPAAPERPQRELVRLSEFGYARFCRNFEEAALRYLRDHPREFQPGRTCVVLNDIAEGPDAGLLAAMGYPILSIWHVDVVDFFNKMYFYNLVGPERFTRGFDAVRRWGLGWAVPDVLRLVFEKQRRVVAHSARLVFPSAGMARTVLRCYGPMEGDGTRGATGPSLERRLRVVPWGGWEEPEMDGVEALAERLRRHYQLRPHTRVLMTLSRISPEKGLTLLVEALRILEVRRHRPGQDLCLLLCGEPAFMRGRTYLRQLRRAVGRLRRTRVFFPGYLSAMEKMAYFRIADLFVSPSIHESYGLSVVEALRAGLPVLASDHSGVEEILGPAFSRVVVYGGRAGGFLSWLGRRGDIPERLAGAVEELLDSPRTLVDMGQAARAAGLGMSFETAARRVAEEALGLLPP